MKNIQKKTHSQATKKENEQVDQFPGYPQYPANEDIYNKFDKEFDIDPEDISKKKNSIKIDNTAKLNVKDFNEDQIGGGQCSPPFLWKFDVSFFIFSVFQRDSFGLCWVNTRLNT